MKPIKQLIVLFFALILVSACGGGSSTPSASGGSSAAPAATVVKADKGMVKVANDPKLGAYLTDGSGMTLYTYANDEKGKSNCTSFCLQSWPAFSVADGPKPGEGVQAAMLSTFKREDGMTQITYNGLPLYQYRADVKEGDVKGQNSSQLWYIIAPTGEVNKTAPPAS